MTPADHARAAVDLLEAEQTGQQIGHLSRRHPEMTMDDAYAVQKALVEAKLGQGRKIIGWKIGLTSKAMQSALGIDIPDSGVLFDDMQFDIGTKVPASRFIQPRVEAEIAFVMKADLGGDDVTREQVFAATDFNAPRWRSSTRVSCDRIPRPGRRARSMTRLLTMRPMRAWFWATSGARWALLICAGSGRLWRGTAKSKKPVWGRAF